MRIVLVTDAWHPQTNGVVTTLAHTVSHLRAWGHDVNVLSAEGLPTIPCPSYPEIRLALFPGKRVESYLDELQPDAIHIATEGTLGLAARAHCVRRRLPHTTSYHTQYPEYVAQRYPIPVEVGYGYVRWFHGLAQRTLVPTPGIRAALAARGLTRLALWSRGVDLARFRPRDKHYFDLPRPVMLYAGRVAVEKNLDAFLRLSLPGTKVVVGDGPAREQLQRRHPTVVFTGYKFGDELAGAIAAANVFVFPSLTDTFGLVMLEAMACGVPVAALPASAPADVIEQGVTGVIDQDLKTAIRAALALSPDACRRYAEQFTWQRAARQFLDALAPIERANRLPRRGAPAFGRF
jgi:glycosyltransferase involved in cell wall biosynthesis